MSGAAGAGVSLNIDTYYPMFAVKLFSGKNDTTNNPPDSSNIEIPMRRALQFDESNTTTLNGSETNAEIKTILDASKYTCNPTFKASSTTIKAIKISHFLASGSSLSLQNYGEFAFNGSAFNIYDHACNAETNISYGKPSQMGSITSGNLDGNAISVSVGSSPANVFVNMSTHISRSGNNFWGSDNGDYCFLGISDKTTSGNNSDALDKEMANNTPIGRAMAFGISDSDGTPTSGQKVKDGISRRGNGYWSLCTNWRYKNANTNGTIDNALTVHSGSTITGYFVVYGKVKAV